MSGAVRAALTVDTVVGRVREADCAAPVAVISSLVSRADRSTVATSMSPSATAVTDTRRYLSGSSGTVDAGVC